MGETMLDADGQPLNEGFNWRWNMEKAAEQLLGICRGLIADRTLNEDEVIYLDSWLKSNQRYLGKWPATVICSRVHVVLADGRATAEECAHLCETLKAIIGGGIVETGGLASGGATRLPIDPVESLSFGGKQFCLTGKFVFGTRAKCATAVIEHGGMTARNVLQSTDYLVIGQLSSRDWKHSSYGRKIEKAIELKAEGRPLNIISEERWSAFL